MKVIKAEKSKGLHMMNANSSVLEISVGYINKADLTQGVLVGVGVVGQFVKLV